jgi:hypothetical protein
MDISGVSTSLASNSITIQNSILIVKQSLEAMKKQGLNAVAIIQATAPDLGNGNGNLVNYYA